MANNHAKGLLYILASPGKLVSPQELYAWFEGEWTRNIPNVLNAIRYEAVDNQKPEFLAVYELANPAIVRLSQLEAEAASSFETVDMRIYDLFSEKTSPKYASASNNRIFRTLALQPGPDLSEKDYNDWYEQEHVPLLSVVPGWLKSTRWTLREAKAIVYGEEQKDKRLSQYFAVHEWESIESLSLPEFKHATSTPWRDQILPKIDRTVDERRNFKPQKQTF
ncbi:uncharacterized protein PFLUO_LOCUS2048 [Penicillium psychrofluorescens]|uniref:uncharacterized protein n=1 Tax=Penicillium psychrofluorescens TaxID=3158075 RepID=UPI003CCD1110